MDLLIHQQQFMHNYYNEIVIDPEAVHKALPHSVMAVFYHFQSSGFDREWAQAVHTRFLQDYRLTPARFPLLEFHGEPDGPTFFTCVICS